MRYVSIGRATARHRSAALRALRAEPAPTEAWAANSPIPRRRIRAPFGRLAATIGTSSASIGSSGETDAAASLPAFMLSSVVT